MGILKFWFSQGQKKRFYLLFFINREKELYEFYPKILNFVTENQMGFCSNIWGKQKKKQDLTRRKKKKKNVIFRVWFSIAFPYRKSCWHCYFRICELKIVHFSDEKEKLVAFPFLFFIFIYFFAIVLIFCVSFSFRLSQFCSCGCYRLIEVWEKLQAKMDQLSKTWFEEGFVIRIWGEDGDWPPCQSWQQVIPFETTALLISPEFKLSKFARIFRCTSSCSMLFIYWNRILPFVCMHADGLK